MPDQDRAVGPAPGPGTVGTAKARFRCMAACGHAARLLSTSHARGVSHRGEATPHPVFVLSESTTWPTARSPVRSRISSISMPIVVPSHPTARIPRTSTPISRDAATLARPWAIPGHAGPRAPAGRTRETARRHRQREPTTRRINEQHVSTCARRRWSGIASDIRARARRSTARRTGAKLLVLSWGGTHRQRCRQPSVEAAASATASSVSPMRTCAISTRSRANLGYFARLATSGFLVPELNSRPTGPAVACSEFLKPDVIPLPKVKGSALQVRRAAHREVEASNRRREDCPHERAGGTDSS